MSQISSRTDPAVTAAPPEPAVDAASIPNRVERRLFDRRLGDMGKQFALRLRARALWIKQFLHGRP